MLTLEVLNICAALFRFSDPLVSNALRFFSSLSQPQLNFFMDTLHLVTDSLLGPKEMKIHINSTTVINADTSNIIIRAFFSVPLVSVFNKKLRL